VPLIQGCEASFYLGRGNYPPWRRSRRRSSPFISAKRTLYFGRVVGYSKADPLPRAGKSVALYLRNFCSCRAVGQVRCRKSLLHRSAVTSASLSPKEFTWPGRRHRVRKYRASRLSVSAARSSKHLWSAKWVQFLSAHSRPTFVSPSSRTMSESPSATAARIERPSDDQDTRRAMNVARSPKSVI
jgi:hypothetical protein